MVGQTHRQTINPPDRPTSVQVLSDDLEIIMEASQTLSQTLQDDMDELRPADIAWLENEMVKRVKRHQLPPSALGSRRSSLLHKLHAFYHSYWNETGSLIGISRAHAPLRVGVNGFRCRANSC